MNKPEKPYGYEMEIKMRGDRPNERIHRVAPTEKAARRLAMLRPNAIEVVSIEPFTLEEYRRVFGYGRM